MDGLEIPKTKLIPSDEWLDIHGVKEDLSTCKWFFHDYDKVKIILGEEAVSLTDFGERLLRDVSSEILIGETRRNYISCLKIINEYLSYVLQGNAFNMTANNILDRILSGDLFYDEVRLVIDEETVSLKQLKRLPIHRHIIVKGECYLFGRVLLSIQSVLTEFGKEYEILYPDLTEETVKRKREELRRRLNYVDERVVIVPNRIESSENVDGEDTLRIPNERFGGSEDSITLLK